MNECLQKSAWMMYKTKHDRTWRTRSRNLDCVFSSSQNEAIFLPHSFPLPHNELILDRIHTYACAEAFIWPYHSKIHLLYVFIKEGICDEWFVLFFQQNAKFLDLTYKFAGNREFSLLSSRFFRVKIQYLCFMF